MSLLAHLKGKGPNGFGYGSTAEQVTNGIDLHGQTMLVTGCNSGLGRETVRVLALRGARVIGTGRTVEKAREGLAGLGDSNIWPLACELSEPASVRACIDAVTRDGARLDAMICNAGIMAVPELRQAHGIELQFFTNHIGHFILVTGLLERLRRRGAWSSSPAMRIAALLRPGSSSTTCPGARGYVPWKAYGQSKLANMLFAKELARRLAGGRTANAVHPGVIATNLSRSMPALARFALRAAAPLVLKDESQGAATQVFLATHPSVAGVTGQYFSHCQRAEPEPIANDPALAARLWQESERIVAGLA